MNNTGKKFTAFFLIAAASVCADQAAKSWASGSLMNEGPQVLIPNVLEFLYTENRGAAFGILQGRQLFFYLIAGVVMAFILYIVARMPAGRKYTPLFLSLVFIFSGAVGNLIDRAARHYVVDFIYFMPIDFPVFNVADIFVTVSTFVLIFLFLFVYKEDDLQFITGRKHPA